MTSFKKTIPEKPAYNKFGFITSEPKEAAFQFHDGHFYRLNVEGEIFVTKLIMPILGRKCENERIFNKIAAFKEVGKEFEFTIDCDLEMFRLILNYCHSGLVNLPKEFKLHHLLIQEARKFEMHTLAHQVNVILDPSLEYDSDYDCYDYGM